MVTVLNIGSSGLPLSVDQLWPIYIVAKYLYTPDEIMCLQQAGRYVNHSQCFLLLLSKRALNLFKFQLSAVEPLSVIMQFFITENRKAPSKPAFIG